MGLVANAAEMRTCRDKNECATDAHNLAATQQYR